MILILTKIKQNKKKRGKRQQKIIISFKTKVSAQNRSFIGIMLNLLTSYYFYCILCIELRFKKNSHQKLVKKFCTRNTKQMTSLLKTNNLHTFHI